MQIYTIPTAPVPPPASANIQTAAKNSTKRSLEMAAHGRTADLAGGGLQTAPRRALPEKLPQRGQHPNCRRSGMTATPLLGWRTEIHDRRDQVQEPEVQSFLPCLKLQIWSSLIDNAPRSGCTTTVPLNRSATAPSTLSISGNRLLVCHAGWRL